MNLQDVMQMGTDPNTLQTFPERYERLSPEQKRIMMEQVGRPVLEHIIPLSGGLKIVRGAPKAVTKALAKIKKPKVRKKRGPDFVPMKERPGYVQRSERGMKDGFKSIGAEEFHGLLDKIKSLDVETHPLKKYCKQGESSSEVSANTKTRYTVSAPVTQRTN